jgi:hypothetical protein
MTSDAKYMEKNRLTPAIYHGANAFAKEHSCETIYAGFGYFGLVPDNRRASS